MKILLIGGTGFMGPSTVACLQEDGHSVTVFHRGKTSLPAGAEEILGDHHQLAGYRAEFARRNFDVVIDFILSSGRQSKTLMETFRGITRRVVALSSMDVYRAMGIISGTETGLLQELPLTEESELRTNRNTYSPEAMKRVRDVYPWADDQYDKIPVEEAVLGDRELSGTVLRLPMVYGPGDPLHRFHHILKRMDDGRRHIIFPDDVAAWRTPRGFVENVGAAIALAATSDQAEGRIYNVCETESFSELEWAQKIAQAVGWKGEFLVLPRDQAPQHLVMPARIEQDMAASSERLRRELGYREPISMAEAMQRTIVWERANQPAQPMYAPFKYAEEDEALAKLKATA
ncbi:MAG TPA: NAD-dependent epimerase/dehydratase family protein [Candidatus Angelobacter sp.]